MSSKKNVYNQAKRGVKRYKKAKARKKGRAAIFAVETNQEEDKHQGQ